MLGNRVEKKKLATEKNSEGKKMKETKITWKGKKAKLLICIYPQKNLKELKDRLEINNLNHHDLYK